MEDIDQKARLERLREKKRARQMKYQSSAPSEVDTSIGGQPSSNMQGQEAPSNTPSPKEKSPLHALFFDAADAWIQSNQTLSSESGSSHSGSSKPSPAVVTREVSDHAPSVERTFDASEGDISEEETPVISSAVVPTFDDGSEELVPTSNEVEPQPEQHQAAIQTASTNGESEVQIDGSAESIVSMESADNEEDDEFDDDMHTDGSLISTEDRLTTGSSFDSLGDTSLNSDVGSLDELFLKIQQQKRRSSWSTYKSLSSSSTFSDEDLRDIFIKDAIYSWIPAKVLEYQQTHAIVAIDPPLNWKEATVLQEEPILSPSDLHPSMTNELPSDIARLTAEYGDLPRCQLRRVAYKNYDLEEFPLQNPPGQGKRDMADLLELHPASILYNLKDRHYAQKPYTRVGDIIIAMNPFVWLDDLYTAETRDTYSVNLIWEAHQNALKGATDFSKRKSIYDDLGFDPHVYETSALAYRDLSATRQDQTILVTGESGAGKTETVKIVMNYLATVQQTRPGGVPTEHSSAKEIVDRVCKSSPVFEAFGNAKTVRNTNSSRFGKFIQLAFQIESEESAKAGGRPVPFTDLIGSSCITYLLEKNRVVDHADGERTYHIFYQLLAAPTEFKANLWSSFAEMTSSDFSFTAEIGGSASDDDALLWEETKAALELFKFQGDDLNTLMKALAIVLQLGNLIFSYDPDNQEESGAIIKNKPDLAILSYMSGIDAKRLEEALTSRVLSTRGHDDIRVGLSPQVAKESCDALAKEIYSKIFDLMVRRINEYTASRDPLRPDERIYGRISMLDIFGFERFKTNRFEQMCINYANERLHHKYVLDNFNAVKDEYEAEGVDLYDFSLVDNTAILDLLEGKPGIISSLNEECLRPKGNPESFVYKLKQTHKTSKILIDRKLHRKYEFGINHFTGPVEYNARNFVERNMDKLPDGVIECASESTNAIIRNEFATFLASRDNEANDSVKKSKSGKRTVLGKFQVQLKSLLTAIEGTRTRYIRCIKPNTTMIPRKTNQVTTMQQLECSGLMTALIMSRESFPNKQTYDFLVGRYACLIKILEKDMPELQVLEPKEKVDHMLAKWLKPLSRKRRNGTRTMPYACGNTKVFFKAGAQDRLEELRSQLFEKNAVIVQAWGRRNNAVVAFVDAKKKACRLQAWARKVAAMVVFTYKKRKACTIQAWTRKISAMESFADKKAKAITIQAWARKNNAVTSFVDKKTKALKLQAWARKVAAATAFEEKKGKACKLQAWARKVAAMDSFADTKANAITIQAWARRNNAATTFADKRTSALVIQTWARKLSAVDAFCAKKRSALTIQSYSRKVAARTAYAYKKNKACKIQSCARMSIARTNFSQQRHAATLIAAWIRGRRAVALLNVMKREMKLAIFRSAVLIQSLVRRWLAKCSFDRNIDAVSVSRGAIPFSTDDGANGERVVPTEEQAIESLQSLAAVAASGSEDTLQRELMDLRARNKMLELDSAEAARQRAEVEALRNSNSKLEEKLESINWDELARLGAEAESLRDHNGKLKEKLRSIDWAETSRIKAENEILRDRNNQLKEKLGTIESAEVEKLRAEVASLQDRNSKLEERLGSTKAQRDALASQNTEATNESVTALKGSVAALNKRVKELTDTNDAVVKEAFKYRAELKKAKRHQKSQAIQAESKLTIAEEELARVTESRETDVKELTENIRENEKKFEEERREYKEEISSLTGQHAKDVESLTEELRKTHESHQEYLTTLMDTLEKTHAMRVQETEKISKELEVAKAEKDRQIRVLKQEIRLLCARKSGLQNIRSVIDVKSMRDDFYQESESRARRSAQFDDAVQQLNSLVAESNQLPSDPDDYDIKKLAKQQERAQKISDMVDTLNCIYKLEEDSRENSNQTALDMIEEFVAVTEPDRIILELKGRLAEEEFTASKLREELKEKEVCKRCEIRNAAARRRIQKSAAN